MRSPAVSVHPPRRRPTRPDRTVEVVDAEARTSAPPLPTRWRPSPLGRAARTVVLVLLGAGVATLPVLIPTGLTFVMALAVVYAVIGLSMNVLVGYAGQISLGHHAFVGVGGLASGYGMTELGLPWVAAAGLSALVGGLSALLLGFVALRLSGLYLALVTIAYGLFSSEVIFNFEPLTGGGAAMEAPRPELFSGPAAYVYLCLLVLAAVVYVDWRLTSSRAGRAIRALRDDPRVAASWGIDVTRYKLLAFVISGVIAAIGGALFASIQEVAAGEDFTFNLSLTFLIMVVIGGVGNRWGVMIGSVLLAVLPAIFGTIAILVSAALLLVVLTVVPGGLAQLLAPLLRWLSFERLLNHDDEVTMAATPSAER